MPGRATHSKMDRFWSIMRQRLVTLWASALVLVVVGVILFAPLCVTLDGYSHVYHSRVLLSLFAGDAPAREAFAYQSPLIPNWLTALSLAALETFLPANWALSLLMIAAFLAALHGLVHAARAASGGELRSAEACLILVPFAASGFLTMGFFGYVVSMALSFHVLAAVLGPRLGESWSKQAFLAGLLVLAYWFHPFPILISLLFVPARLAVDFVHGPRPALGHAARCLAPWVPAVVLALWFSMELNPGEQLEAHEVSRVAMDRMVLLSRPTFFAELAPTFTATTPYLLLIGALAALVFSQPLRRSTLTLLLLFAGLLCAYVLSPENAGDAARISIRLLFWAVLFLALAALAGGMRNVRILALCGLLSTACVLVFSMEYVIVAVRLAPAMDELAAAVRGAPGGSTALFLGYEQNPGCLDWGLVERSAPQRHWGMLPAAEAGLIVLNDYQPTTTHFPLRYRDRRFIHLINELRAHSVRQHKDWTAALADGQNLPDFVAVWGVPNVLLTDCGKPIDPPLTDALAQHFERVYENNNASYAALWRKRR